jgi:glycosyltransferase involved in cell wall biosynthesis
MNILFICSAKAWGGNEKWVSIAMEGLKQRHNVFFLGKDHYLKGRFGADLPFYSTRFASVFDLTTKKTIEKIVNENKIDVIVSTKKKGYFLAGLAARSLGVKHVLRLGIVRKMKWPLWHRLVYGRLNDGVIVNAHRIKNELLKYSWMRNHPVEVIYNGIPGLKETPRADYVSEPFTIVSTGMLTRRKGFHLLIEAVAKLPKELRSCVKVHILGKGREEESLKGQIKRKGLEEVIFTEGFTDPKPWLAKASLFCLLSANEGISNALVEAMAAGIPVLTTDAGGAGEFIVDLENGYLVRRDVKAIGHKLNELINMPSEQLRISGEKGRKTVSALFDMDRMVEELEMFLHNFT